MRPPLCANQSWKRSITLHFWCVHYSEDLFMIVQQFYLCRFGVHLSSRECLIDDSCPSEEVMDAPGRHYNYDLYFKIVALYTIQYFPPTFLYTECSYDYVSTRWVLEVAFLTRIAKISPSTRSSVVELLKMVQNIRPLIWSHVSRFVGKSQVHKIVFFGTRQREINF